MKLKFRNTVNMYYLWTIPVKPGPLFSNLYSFDVLDSKLIRAQLNIIRTVFYHNNNNNCILVLVYNTNNTCNWRIPGLQLKELIGGYLLQTELDIEVLI